MGILFSDVYRKAIALFDDPRITTAYETNPLQFNKIMYTYLQNAISMFNNPDAGIILVIRPAVTGTGKNMNSATQYNDSCYKCNSSPSKHFSST